MSNPWSTITGIDVEARIPANLLAVVRERFNDAGTDPMPVIIRDVIARVRGAVASCRNYHLDQDTTLLPPELVDDAAYLVVGGLLLRLGEATPIGDALKTRIEHAETRLLAVAKCEYSVSSPENPQGSPSAQPIGKVSQVSGEPRRNTPARLSGLL